MSNHVNWGNVTAIKINDEWLPLREGTHPEVEVTVEYEFGHLEKRATVAQRLHFKTDDGAVIRTYCVPLTDVKAVRETLV